MSTTIQLAEETRDRLATLKRHPRETYEEVVRRLVDGELEDALPLTRSMKGRLDRARRSAREGRLLTTEELIEEIGL